MATASQSEFCELIKPSCALTILLSEVSALSQQGRHDIAAAALEARLACALRAEDKADIVALLAETVKLNQVLGYTDRAAKQQHLLNQLAEQTLEASVHPTTTDAARPTASTLSYSEITRAVHQVRQSIPMYKILDAADVEEQVEMH